MFAFSSTKIQGGVSVNRLSVPADGGEVVSRESDPPWGLRWANAIRQLRTNIQVSMNRHVISNC